MKIGIDMDGVLANFESGFAPILSRLSGVTFPIEDADFPPVWGWPMLFMEPVVGKKEARKIETAAWAIVGDDPTFWQTLKPFTNTIEILNTLDDLKHDGHDVYFITHRFGEDAKLQTERWLSFFGMSNPTVLRSGTKGPIVHGLGLDCFIDDKPMNCIDVLEFAIKNGGATRVYVQARPYNAHMMTGPRLQRVASVLEMLDQEMQLWLDHELEHAADGPSGLPEEA